MGLASPDVKQMATTSTEESGTPDSKGSDNTKESTQTKRSDDAVVLDAPEGHIEPNSHDVLLSDVTSEKLHGEVSENLGVVYLSTVPEEDEAHILKRKTFYGKKCGKNSRFMVNLPCRRWSERNHPSSPRQPFLFHNIVFLVDTESPYNCLCQEAMEALLGGHGGNPVPRVLTVALTSGLKLEFHISPSSGHFGDVSVLGGVSFFQSVDIVSRCRDADFTLAFD